LNAIFQLFDLVITNPMSWLLNWLVAFLGSYGPAIIVFTIIIRLVLVPLAVKQKRNMLDTARISPKLKELEKMYKNNRQKYNEEVQKLYSREGVNPMSSCLPLFIQIPIMLGLYQVATKPLRHLMKLSSDQILTVANRAVELFNNNQLASKPGIDLNGAIEKIEAFIAKPAIDNVQIYLSQIMDGNVSKFSDISNKIFGIDFNFLGMNLALIPPNPLAFQFSLLTLLPIVSAVTQFLYTKMVQKTQPDMGAAANSMKTMNFMMPLFTLWIGFTFPAVMTLYWTIGNIVMIAQEPLIARYINKMAEIKGRKTAPSENSSKVVETTGDVIEDSTSSVSENSQKTEKTHTTPKPKGSSKYTVKRKKK